MSNNGSGKSPAFQFYPRDWLGDPEIMLMDWDARAMHLHLICIAWTSSDACSIPDDDDILMRWLFVTDQGDWLKRLKPQIFKSWKKDGNDWVQSRLKRERIRQLAHSEKRKEAANKRWGKEKKGTDASAMQKQCPSSSPSTSSTDNKEPVKKFTADDLMAAEFIRDRILKLNPTMKPPNMNKWADEIRLMRERDKRTHREICELFAWCNDHDFWRSNILSPKILRNKWDDLIIKRGHGSGKGEGINRLKLPTMDEQLPKWAQDHDFPQAREGESWPQYRGRLNRLIEEKSKNE